MSQYQRTKTKMRSSKAQYKRHAKELEALACSLSSPTRKQFWYCAVLLVDAQYSLEDWFRSELTELRRKGLSKQRMCDVIKEIIVETGGASA